jgi:threonine dehydrogenase-like Zn-dependent dehydrogenase
MRATVMYKAGDVRVENIPDAALSEPTDAVIRITRASICGSDLWPYNLGPAPGGQRMGHEAIGIVEDVGSEVQRVKRGDVVIMPFASSDGTCTFCHRGCPLPASTLASSALGAAWMEPRPRLCAFLGQTGHFLSFPPVLTTRLCPRCSLSRT